MNRLFYDLHIHSCLSPCGDQDMTPANIVNMAMLKELDVIAVTDHNSCKNCPAVLHMAEEAGILAIPGMELCTSEEIHVLCLFPTLKDAMEFDLFVSEQLVRIPNDEKIFGAQEIYDENDNRIGTEKYLLINAAQISFDHLDELVKRYHGIYIPAHLDKKTNSLISNFGLIPPDAKFLCAEIKNPEIKEEYKRKHSYLEQCRIITNSDAHYLEDINEAINEIEVECISVQGVLEALRRKDPFINK